MPERHCGAARGAGARGIPVVYEMRASWEDAAVDHGTTTEGSLRYRLSRGLETWTLRRADAVTTICEGLRADILGRGVAADRVTVIPNAVDPQDFPLIDAAGRGLTVAARTARRLHARLHRFVLRLRGTRYAGRRVAGDPALEPRTRVLLVGGGFEEERLKAQAAELGVADKVIFAGRVPHGDVARYYSVVDLLVYPRKSIRLTETVTPLKPLEAMAQGRLLIASDVGGHRELIRDGETGIPVPAGRVRRSWPARCGECWRSRDRWDAIASRGRRFVEIGAQLARQRRAATRRVYERGRSLAVTAAMNEVFASAAGRPVAAAVGRHGQPDPPAQAPAGAGGPARRRSCRPTRRIGRPGSRRLRGVRAAFRLLPYLAQLWRRGGRADVVHVMANSGLRVVPVRGPGDRASPSGGEACRRQLPRRSCARNFSRGSAVGATRHCAGTRLVVPSRFLRGGVRRLWRRRPDHSERRRYGRCSGPPCGDATGRTAAPHVVDRPQSRTHLRHRPWRCGRLRCCTATFRDCALSIAGSGPERAACGAWRASWDSADCVRASPVDWT